MYYACALYNNLLLRQKPPGGVTHLQPHCLLLNTFSDAQMFSDFVLPSGLSGHATQACHPQGVASSESLLCTYLQGTRELLSESFQAEKDLFTGPPW